VVVEGGLVGAGGVLPGHQHESPGGMQGLVPTRLGGMQHETADG